MMGGRKECLADSNQTGLPPAADMTKRFEVDLFNCPALCLVPLAFTMGSL